MVATSECTALVDLLRSSGGSEEQWDMRLNVQLHGRWLHSHTCVPSIVTQLNAPTRATSLARSSFRQRTVLPKI